MGRQIILDTETTGLHLEKGHRIIEIACLEMVNRQITDSVYHSYLNPERAVEKGAFNIHGLNEEFLADKPKFHEIMDEFLAYIKGAELIIHNAKFDVGFINHELKLAKSRIKSIEQHCNVIDTLVMARRKHPGQRNSLDALCKRYNVDNTKRTLHGALIDCQLLADVYLLMTGGQKKLFEQDESTQLVSTAIKKTIERANKKQNLVVIKATCEEENAHKTFLNDIKAVADQSVWLADNL